MNKLEKAFYTLLIILIIFTFGVQTGIHHGIELQKQEDQRQERMLEYIFKKMASCEVS